MGCAADRQWLVDRDARQKAREATASQCNNSNGHDISHSHTHPLSLHPAAVREELQQLRREVRKMQACEDERVPHCVKACFQHADFNADTDVKTKKCVHVA